MKVVTVFLTSIFREVMLFYELMPMCGVVERNPFICFNVYLCAIALVYNYYQKNMGYA